MRRIMVCAYSRDSWRRAGAPPRVRTWFWMDSRVARSSEPPSASSIRACTMRGEQLVAPEPLRLQVGVHAALLAGLPELHQLVDAVDQGRGAAVRRRLAEGRGRGAGSRV